MGPGIYLYLAAVGTIKEAEMAENQETSYQTNVDSPMGSDGGGTIQGREHMARIGRKGGESVSQDRGHMAEIGRKGGESVSQNREHMAAIGRKGGEAISQNRSHMAEIGKKGGESR